MSTEENKRLAREAISIWTTGDLDAADEVYAPDYVNHQHHDPDDLRGVEAMKSFAAEFPVLSQTSTTPSTSRSPKVIW